MIDYDLQVRRAQAITELLANNPNLLPESTIAMWQLKLRRIAVTEEELRHNMRKVG
jgi:hypothetical protein